MLVILGSSPPSDVPPEVDPMDSITWTCPLLPVGLGDGDIGRRSEVGGAKGWCAQSSNPCLFDGSGLRLLLSLAMSPSLIDSCSLPPPL